MPATSILFESETVPCGRVVDGEHLQDQDNEGLLIDDFYFACGCRCIRHEYHDGSVFRQVVRHDGTVVADELLAEHHP